MRYEIKYVFPEDALEGLIVRVLSLPGQFGEIYAERQVNNIYFDTLDLADYRNALNGAPRRAKTRVRWYGALDNPAVCALEVKYKYGMAGGKEITPFAPFDLAALRGLKVDNRVPALVNTYRRRYFETPDKLLRVTIDSGLRYFHPAQHLTAPAFGAAARRVVLEVKFERETLAAAAEKLQGFPWRADKHSKYVNGINAAHFGGTE